MSTFVNTLARLAGRLTLALGFSAVVVLLLLWLAGKFSPKVPQDVPAAAHEAPPAGDVVEVELLTVPLVETAVGSIRAVHETSIGSKLLARVMEVNLKAGQPVRAGDVLIRLDDTDLRARLEQAKAAVVAAEATQTQAAGDEKRGAALLKSRALSPQEYERLSANLRAAQAQLIRSRGTVDEVQATLDWATIRAPLEGLVIDKKVDVGDMVTPGQTLVTLFDPKRMQLVASVRESLKQRLQVGQSIGVSVDGLDKQCTGTVSEIVPESQAASRSFLVKVTGPCPPGISTGMFGRLYIPLAEEQVLVIPARAVRQIGQLELVDVVEDGRSVRRAIRTGRPFGDRREVLSGLRKGERLLIHSAQSQEPSHG